jgi:hypothetical protein
MISNSRMQITLLSFLFKKFNIIKNESILKIHRNYMLSCSVIVFRIRKGRLVLKQLSENQYLKQTYRRLPSFSRFFRSFFLRKLLKFTKSCKNASKNEICLQENYQSSNQEMFAISLSSCSRYNANFKLDQSVFDF